MDTFRLVGHKALALHPDIRAESSLAPSNHIRRLAGWEGEAMARIRVSWDGSAVKTLRVSIDGVRVSRSGTERTVPNGTVVLSWFALGNPGTAFTIVVTGLAGTLMSPGPEFPCPTSLSRTIPDQRTKDFGACEYMVAD